LLIWGRVGGFHDGQVSFLLRDELNKRLTDACRAILDVNDPADRVRLTELKFHLGVDITLLGLDALEVFDDEGDVHLRVRCKKNAANAHNPSITTALGQSKG